MEKDQEKNASQNGVDDAQNSELIEQSDFPPEIREALEALPSKDRAKVLKAIQVSRFSGPLPPPQMLGEYEKVLPGSADRIIKLAEENAQHRQVWESKILSASTSYSTQNNWFRFLLALVAVGGAIFLANQGASPLPYVLVVYALVGLVSRFLKRAFPSSSDD